MFIVKLLNGDDGIHVELMEIQNVSSDGKRIYLVIKIQIYRF